MSLGSYGRLATEAYDSDKPIGHSFGDVEFYLQKLRSCTGPVLEPAVGTGRVLIPLLEAGIEVEGVDNSPEMLAICRARCAERELQPVLQEGHMGSLSLPQRYEAIIVPAGSFLLIERREESLGTLKRFREHLLPGGRLILDLELQTDFRLGNISTGTVETPQGETITTEAKVVEVNFLEQYSVSHLRYEKWRDDELLQTEMQRIALRWYGLDEFELVLKSLGFSEVMVSADYEYGKRPTCAEQSGALERRRGRHRLGGRQDRHQRPRQPRRYPRYRRALRAEWARHSQRPGWR
jgi:SAM-dependent methyltransferase